MAAIDKFTNGAIVFLSLVWKQADGSTVLGYLSFDGDSGNITLKENADSGSAWQVVTTDQGPDIFRLRSVGSDGDLFLNAEVPNTINVVADLSTNTFWKLKPSFGDGARAAFLNAPFGEPSGWLRGDPKKKTVGLAAPNFNPGDLTTEWTVTGP